MQSARGAHFYEGQNDSGWRGPPAPFQSELPVTLPRSREKIDRGDRLAGREGDKFACRKNYNCMGNKDRCQLGFYAFTLCHLHVKL